MHDASTAPLILASTSTYRARLLARLRLPFTTFAPRVDETPHPHEPGPTLAERLAIAKAKATHHTEGAVIGSDQVAVCNGRLLGKPGNADRARHQLSECAGQSISFYTGVALWQPSTQYLLTHIEPYRVTLRDLTEEEIHHYITLDQPLDCAGSFKWESLGITLFESMQGDDPTALEGLPLIALSKMLRALGYSLPPSPESAAHS